MINLTKKIVKQINICALSSGTKLFWIFGYFFDIKGYTMW